MTKKTAMELTAGLSIVETVYLMGFLSQRLEVKGVLRKKDFVEGRAKVDQKYRNQTGIAATKIGGS